MESHLIVTNHERLAPGHHHEDEERRDDCEERGEDVHPQLHLARGHRLLEEELETVGHGLEDPVGTRPIGADPALHFRQDLALRPDVDDGRHQEQHEGEHHAADHDPELRPAHFATALTRTTGSVPSEAPPTWLNGT